jgi:hypothetical protein
MTSSINTSAFKKRWVLLGCLLLASCQATGSASFKLNTSIDAKIRAAGRVVGVVRVGGSNTSKFYLVKTTRGHTLEYAGSIEFAYDKATLDGSETLDTLEGIQGILQEYPKLKLQIEGHTDSRGSDDYNLSLSKKRAESIRQWLIKNGVEERRLTAEGKGESEPRKQESSDCKDKKPSDPKPCEETWATNRRAQLVIVEGMESLQIVKVEGKQ